LNCAVFPRSRVTKMGRVFLTCPTLVFQKITMITETISTAKYRIICTGKVLNFNFGFPQSLLTKLEIIHSKRSGPLPSRFLRNSWG